MHRSYYIAFAIIVVAALWIISGQFGDEAPENAGAGPAGLAQNQSETVQARVAHLVASPITRKVVVQGETRPNRAVEVKAELRGQIVAVTKERGAQVEEGEALFTIADNGHTLQLQKAESAIELRKAEFEAATSLAQTGFNSRIRLNEATSNLRSAEAELLLRQIDVDNLTIKAPFSGVLDERLVEVGDLVEVGRAVAKVVELDPIKIVGRVSESNIADVKVGMMAEVELVDGRSIPAELTFRSSTSDPDTRTFEVELLAPNPLGEVIGGLTATINLPTGEKEGHLVSPSVLALSDSGAIGVKIVDETSRIQFIPVVILEEGPEGTWIGGLPREIDLVIVGQDFLSVGEVVERVFLDEGNRGGES